MSDSKKDETAKSTEAVTGSGAKATKNADEAGQEALPLVPRGKKLVALCLAATAVLTAMDLASKNWAVDNLSTEPVVARETVCEPNAQGHYTYQRIPTPGMELMEDHLELAYAENCGAAFSMLKTAPSAVRHGVFGLAAVVASFVLFWMFATGRGGTLFSWAVPFIVSGALGNLADRIRFGYVVDFIRFYWRDPLPLIGTQWPTFNVADITITIGVVLLLIDGWVVGRQEAAAEKARLAGEATSAA